MSTFFERLREERKRLGHAQAAMAELGGVKKQSQINYESGKRKPDMDYLAAVAKHGVDTTYVITGLRVPAVVRALQDQASAITTQYGDLVTIGNNAEQLAAEFYRDNPGAYVPTHTFELDGQTFATVPRYDASAAAGGGQLNFDSGPIDHVAFSKAWLDQNAIDNAHCSLINAYGRSMEPSLWDGDMIMIDHQRVEIRSRRIYVYNDPDHGTRVKRLELGSDVIAVQSDNPDKQQYPTEYLTGSAMNTVAQNIVGEVVWSGHRWG